MAFSPAEIERAALLDLGRGKCHQRDTRSRRWFDRSATEQPLGVPCD